MGSDVSRIKDTHFLKSGTDIDISAQGAMCNFLICHHKGGDIGKKIKPSNVRLLNHDTWEHSKITEEQWKLLNEYVASHPATTGKEASDDVPAAIAALIFNPAIAADYRAQVKEATAGRDIVMISLVVSPSNLSSWIDAQKDDQAKRVSKMWEKVV